MTRDGGPAADAHRGAHHAHDDASAHGDASVHGDASALGDAGGTVAVGGAPAGAGDGAVGVAIPTDSDAPPASVPLPPTWADRVAAHLAGELTPVSPRHAATVVLLRDGDDGLDVYLLRRAVSMAFAAGYHAFPGGSVDAHDQPPPDVAAHRSLPGWAGPPPAAWAARFGYPEPQAAALVRAAVRETFEEAGVLFAGPDAASLVADPSDAAWERDRRALASRAITLTELLASRGLVLRADLLAAWSRWITPEFEPRRYDTAFFVAVAPDAQHARDVSGEADQAGWTSLRAVLAAHERGAAAMLPPTVTTLRQLAGYPDAAAVRAAAETRHITPVMPRAVRTSDGGYRLDWSAPGHHGTGTAAPEGGAS
jgi:8-oxo-dGTP pyrophosphatase MutT (NUDIX family)